MLIRTRVKSIHSISLLLIIYKMIVLNLLCGILVTYLLYLLWSRRKFYLLSFKVPTAFGYPIIGVATNFIKRESKFEYNCRKCFEKFLTVYTLHTYFMYTRYSSIFVELERKVWFSISDIFGARSFTNS